jgi:hypothetical protein
MKGKKQRKKEIGELRWNRSSVFIEPFIFIVAFCLQKRLPPTRSIQKPLQLCVISSRNHADGCLIALDAKNGVKKKRLIKAKEKMN